MPPYRDVAARPGRDRQVDARARAPGCRGSRLVATAANGCAAFGSYRPAGPGGTSRWRIQVVEISGGRISGVHNFLYPELFAAFGLPARLEG